MTYVRRLAVAATLFIGSALYAAPPAERPQHAHLVKGESPAEWAKARRAANAASHGLAGQKLAQRKDVDGKKVRKGTYMVGKGKDKKVEVKYTVTEAPTRGAADATIQLTDTLSRVTVTLAFNDEAGTGTISVKDNTIAIGFNPDGTVSVDKKVLPSVADAAWAAANHATLAPLTGRHGAALVELMGALAETTGGSRGNTPAQPPGSFTIEMGCDLSAGC